MRLLSTILFLLAGLVCRAGGVAEVRVLLLPMELAGPATANWLPDALRQNMVNELGRTSRLLIVAAKDAPATSDPEKAREAGQKHRAELVIFGACQIAGADVRLLGQVLDVTSGKIVGVTKLTGSMRDVFGMEDQFASRCKRLSLEAIGEQQARADPVGAFAKNLNQPVPAIKPQNPVRPAAWPWEVEDPELLWAQDHLIYGRRTSTDYYTYPMGNYYGYGLLPGYWGWANPGYGLNMGRGWFGRPTNVSNNANIITTGRSYMSGTSVQWGGNFSFPRGNVQVNVGR
ncbi:MAG: hypothetical protein ABSH20_20535 [Tepidisphaeraceae bacterium]|jgi:TolB-like protein